MKKQLPHGVSGIVIATVVLLALLVVGVYSGKSAVPHGAYPAQTGESGERVGPRTGKMAPALSFTSVDGKKISLEDLKGKVVLVNFWATWCGPCRMEMPTLIKLHNAYKDRGLVILGLSADEKQSDLDAYLKENPLPYLVGRATREQGKDFDVNALPASILIDKTGAIVFDIDGYDESLDFGKLVEKYL